MDIKIFDNEKFQSKNVECQLALLGSFALGLSEAIETYELLGKKDAMRVLQDISKIANPVGCYAFNNLYDVVMEHIAYSEKEKEHEFFYQNLFKTYASKLIDGCKVIDKSCDGHNIPDAWVELYGKQIPVEVKKQNFDKKALAQLLRYMKTYNSPNGIAVAKELKTELPDNVMFIPISRIQEVEMKENI